MSAIVEEDREHVETSYHTIEISNDQNLSNKISQIPTEIFKYGFVPTKDINEITAEKNDHHSIFKRKKQIQILIDYQSPRIGL